MFLRDYIPFLGSSDKAESGKATTGILPPKPVPSPDSKVISTRPLSEAYLRLCKYSEDTQKWIEKFDNYIDDIKMHLDSSPRKMPGEVPLLSASNKAEPSKANEKQNADAKSSAKASESITTKIKKIVAELDPNETLHQVLLEDAKDIAEDSKKLIAYNNKSGSHLLAENNSAFFNTLNESKDARVPKEIIMAQIASRIACRQRGMLIDFRKTITVCLGDEEFIAKLVPVASQRCLEYIELEVMKHIQGSMDMLRLEMNKSFCEFKKAESIILQKITRLKTRISGAAHDKPDESPINLALPRAIPLADL